MKKENEEATIKCVVYLTPEQNKKVEDMSKKLGASKQECIRRIVDEGQVVDLQMEINMEDEFKRLVSEIEKMNRLLQKIYTVMIKPNHEFKEAEKQIVFEQFDYISNTTGELLASIWRTNNSIESKAMTQLKNLIKKNTGRKGGGNNGNT